MKTHWRGTHKLLLLFALGCLALTRSAAGEDEPLRALLQKGVADGYPGAAMFVRYSDGRVRSAAAGFSNLEDRHPLRSDDAFHLASITKTLTAVAILRLVDEGKLSLKAKLKDLLDPSLVKGIPNADRITVSELLDHSSGIYATNNDMDYLSTIIGPKADPTRAWSSREMVALADGKRPSGEPGTGHFYSDTNYVLLGLIVERVAGVPFKAHLTRTLLAPLRMTSTYFYSDYLRKDAHPPVQTVQGYLLATDEVRKAIQINTIFKPVTGNLLNTTLAAERCDPCSGIVSTLPDLLTFSRALFGAKLLGNGTQKFLMSAGEGLEREPMGKKRIRALQAISKPYGVLIYKEGDGPGGVNTLMAYHPATGTLFLGFINSFGHFDEVDFMMDHVIGGILSSGSGSPGERPRPSSQPSS